MIQYMNNPTVMKPEEIKMMRKSLGLTQNELSRLSGVSQSLIARIEAGRVDASFSKIEKISDALERSKGEISVTARDIMRKSPITIRPNEKIIKAAGVMKRRSISQLPVTENDSVVGMISEKEISHSVSNAKNMLVRDIMTDPPPLVSINAKLEVLSDLLDHYQSVLVAENGRIRGIVCRSDLLKLVRR